MPHELLDRKEFRQLAEALREGTPASLDGVWGSARLLAAAAIGWYLNRPVLYVLAATEEIDRAAADYEFFAGTPPLTFPPVENVEPPLLDPEIDEPEPVMTLGDDLFGQRIRLLKRLDHQGDRPSIPLTLITSVSALLQPVPSPEMLRERTLLFAVGDTVEMEPLIRRLIESGYHGTSGIDLPGEFSHRGHLLDIYAPDWDAPVRIEFFGDEIESIRRFDIATQRSLENLDAVPLTRLRAAECFNASLLDYLPADTVGLLVEPEEIEKAGRTYLDRLDNPRNPGLRDRFFTTSDILGRLMRRPFCTFSNLATSPASLNVRLPIESVERLCGTLPTVRAAVEELRTEIVHIVCPTRSESDRLRELFADTFPGREGRLHFPVGMLSSGFRIRGERGEGRGEREKVKGKSGGGSATEVDSSLPSPLIYIGSGQLFARHDIRRTPRKRLGQVIDSFLDLKPGDLVVHLSHGIARYRGLTMLTKGQQEEEHLHLEFANTAAIYVPASKISLVQKYVGGSKTKPQLAKLGGQMWQRQKKAVQEAVFDLASEMLDLQAARDTRPGIAFPEDSDWQSAFDASFPYKETDDQLLAIEAIKQDMRKPRPMDRLLCGDVGFGKTEVALRAVFKAVDAGFQVAILVPTTILAEQHFRTLSERLREFPFTVAAMSRFQSRKEQLEIIGRLATGGVDIVVGTHRLASEDIRFRNLGLVIIDEEQRFGVAHKEKLKKLRTTVDVLTMTATPIPRTLHFSLLGIRDISNLETPPEDRLAVETRLVRFNQDLVRSAIMRELNRGGQIFFVHNKVRDIEQVAARLQRIVPEARIGIGHAQMPDETLEEVMLDFVEHRFDVLVATTIVESGLDIPNANTIFIDEADRYGLAELHQLRGRVGRYKNQAYCYLLLDANKPLSGIAGKRLRAIEEFSHLGAGFNIAMRDLEIRGAGNILGTQQSGHIATVGYEMYCSFLEAAVRVLKQMPPKTVVEVELDLPGSAHIPKSYIESQRQKIDLYRRLTRITTLDEVADMEREMIDRFGKPPLVTRRLLKHAAIRVKAHAWRVRCVRLEQGMMGDPNVPLDGGYVVFDYVARGMMDRLKRILHPIPLRTTDDMKAYVPMPGELGGPGGDPDEILRFVEDILPTPVEKNGFGASLTS